MGEFTRSISTTGGPSSSTSGPRNATPVEIVNEAVRVFREGQRPPWDESDIQALLAALSEYQNEVIALQTDRDQAMEDYQDANRNAELLEARTRELQNNLEQTQQATQHAAQQGAQQGTPVAPAMPITHTRSAKHPDPPEFSGKQEDLEGFKFKLQQKLLMNEDWFPLERSKVGYAFSRLVDKAMTQLLPRVSKPDNPAAILNIDQFYAALELSFGDPDRKNTAQKKIANLKQANRLFSEYLADFQRWIGDTGYDETNQRFYFQNGLSRELQGYLVPVDTESLTFDQLIAKCQLLDTRYRLVRPASTSTRVTTTTTATTIAGNSPAIHTSNTDSNTAMDLSAVTSRPRTGPRGPLTAEERQHRIEKSLCLYCGEPGHLARDCEKKKRAQAARGARINSVNLAPTPTTPSEQGKV